MHARGLLGPVPYLRLVASADSPLIVFFVAALIWPFHRHDRQDSTRNVVPKHIFNSVSLCHLFTDATVMYGYVR